MISPESIIGEHVPAMGGYKWKSVRLRESGTAGSTAITYDIDSGQYVAMLYNSPYALYGVDLDSMYTVSAPQAAWGAIKTANNIGVALTSGSSARCGSISASSAWSSGGAVPAGTYEYIVYFKGKFYASPGTLASDGSLGAPYICTTYGDTWETRYVPVAFGQLRAMEVAFGRLYCTVNTGATFVSDDGLSWTEQSAPVGGTRYVLSYNGNALVSVKYQAGSTEAAVTYDGENWLSATVPAGQWRAGAAKNGGPIWAVENVSPYKLIYTHDGTNWHSAESSNTAASTISYLNNELVLTASTLTLASSHTGNPIKYQLTQDAVATSVKITSTNESRIWLKVDGFPIYNAETIPMDSYRTIELSQPIGQGSIIEIWADQPGVELSLDGVFTQIA
jgi:hypothetical protein